MNGSGEVLQYTDNYPFGLEHNKVATFEELDPKNNYKYNGKELNTDLGLNWYNYGFRMYDPALGRFPSIDPIAEEFAFVSGFNYAENAPISNIDLHGLQKVFFQESLKNSGTFNDA